MIIIANVGQYLNNFAGDSRRKVGVCSGLSTLLGQLRAVL